MTEDLRARERLAEIMFRHSIPTGHGDTIDDLLTELDGWLAEKFTPVVEESVRDDVILEMIGIWTWVCNFSPATATKARIEKLKLRFRDSFHSNMPEWRAYCERIAASSFLSGRETNWRANLTWVLEPRNLAKIMEGRYDDSKGRNRPDRRDREAGIVADARDDLVRAAMARDVDGRRSGPGSTGRG